MESSEDLRELGRRIGTAKAAYARLVEHRNLLILERHSAGRSAAELAVDSGLTEGRVHQILRKQASSPSTK